MAVAPGSNLSSPWLVGREPESRKLAAAMAALLDGHSRVVVISGEAGIGKTRLIDDCLHRAAPALRVLRGECLALGSAIPYLPFADLLRDLVRQVPAPMLAGLLGPARAELARLLPDLATPTGSAAGRDVSAGGSDDLDRLRLYEAFLRVAERVAAEQPTVFVLEDVQWIDSASLELLSFLAHGLRQRNQASVIVSVRPDDLGGQDAVLTLLADLGRDSSADRIELAPLSTEATRELLTAILGESPHDALVEDVHARSDGNPLFVEEILAASADPRTQTAVPPKLRDLMAVRLAHVPNDVLVVLRIAAAAGRAIDDRLLVAASGLSTDQVQHAVRAAVDDHILVRSPDQTGYRFRHEILRSLVAAQLLPDETRRVHATYAQALAEGPPDRRNATEIASHWDAAGEPVRALAAHLAAAQAARAIHAYAEARRHFQRTLELWDEVPEAEAVISLSRTTVLAAAASATAKAGDLRTAIVLTRELIADPPALDDEAYQLARSSLRWYLWEAGDIEAALAEAEAVSDDVPARWRANALAHRAGLLLYLRRTPLAARFAREAMAMADVADVAEERILAEGVLGWCLLLDGDVDAGLAAIRGALDAAGTVESGRLSGRYPVGPVLAHAQLTTALEVVGRFDEMHATAVAGAAVASRQGVARTFGSVLQAGAARALYQLGRWDEATLAVDQAIRGGAVGSGRVALLAVRALLAVGRGEQRLLEQTLADADRLAEDSIPADVRRWLTVARAEDAIWRADPTDALTRIALLAEEADAVTGVRLGGQPAAPDASIPLLLVLGARACADMALQERADGTASGVSRVATEHLEASLRRVRRQRALAAAWAADLAIARAELERSGRDAAARERRWKVAVDLVTSRPYASAYALWRLAEARLARRDGRPEAATAIGQGLVLTEALGAARLGDELRGLAQRARLLVATQADAGVSVSLEGEQRPYGLTAREAEVLTLVAQGLSNGEIAERLFISPKTASVHVSNIYGKLGVETRVAAATVAQGLDLRRLESPPSNQPRR